MYQTPDQLNVTGLDGIMIYTSSQVPILFPLILFAFFVIIFLGSYFAVKRSSGTDAIIPSFVVASIMTFILSVLFSLVGGLIPIFSVFVTFLVLVISLVVLFTHNPVE